MARRYITVPIPAVVAGATVAVGSISSFDDAKPRKLVGFKCSVATKQVQARLDVAGRVFAAIDLGTTSTAEGMIPLDQQFQAGIPFSITFVSAAAGGGAIAANTDNVLLAYEADSSV